MGRANRKPWPSVQPSARSARALALGLDPLGDDRQTRSERPRSRIAPQRAPSPSGVELVDERLGDLQRVERELLQVLQRRVAGAEVVDRDPHAERLAARAAAPRSRLTSRHQHALGDLEHQPARRSGRAARARPRRRRRTRRCAADAETLTRHRAGPARPARGRRGTRLSSTHAPIGTISPVSSASGMNSADGRARCVQRSSASAARDRAGLEVARSAGRRATSSPSLERAPQVVLERQRSRPSPRASRRRRDDAVAALRPWPGTSRGRRRAAGRRRARAPWRRRCSRAP